MIQHDTWRPSWWNEKQHGGAWDRIKEAMGRDWVQTKKDFHAKSGHELNQDLPDTVKQMSGKQPIPPPDRPNPAKVIGNWDDAELPVSYGYGARHQYGSAHPTWSSDLETKLRTEWEQGHRSSGRKWDDVREYVRHGYEYKPH